MTKDLESEHPQERQRIDNWLRGTCTLLGVVLVFGVLIAVGMHMKNQTNFPKPVDLEAGLLLGIGIVLMILFNLPWTKIRIGDVEIERAIEEQAIDYSEEVSELKKVIEELEKNLAEINSTPSKLKGRIYSSKKLQTHKKLQAQYKEDEELLLKFLKKWSTWGFTATRIRNWGGRQQQFQRFTDLSIPHIRTLAADLLSHRKIRTRISRSGSILYQAGHNKSLNPTA